jgi:protein-tyrosine-phosphatase
MGRVGFSVFGRPVMSSIEVTPLMRRALDVTTAGLTEDFDGIFSRESVARCVEESFMQLGGRPTIGPNFLPVIVDRFARERLWAVAQHEPRVERAMPEVLFGCERNAGRSQIAAALANHLSNGWVGVRSAGSHPDERIDPLVAWSMSELGVDMTLDFPKLLTDEIVRAADVVITMGCGDACPVYPGKRYEDWNVADPAGQSLEAMRRIRYDLYHHVADLVESLIPGGSRRSTCCSSAATTPAAPRWRKPSSSATRPRTSAVSPPGPRRPKSSGRTSSMRCAR